MDQTIDTSIISNYIRAQSVDLSIKTTKQSHRLCMGLRTLSHCQHSPRSILFFLARTRGDRRDSSLFKRLLAPGPNSCPLWGGTRRYLIVPRFLRIPPSSTKYPICTPYPSAKNLASFSLDRHGTLQFLCNAFARPQILRLCHTLLPFVRSSARMG